MLLLFNSIQEDQPGEKWEALFKKAWPYYKKWFLSEGYRARPGYLSSYSELEKHMPELVPIYDQLAYLAGGGDLEARFLTMFCPPAYMSGCSQIAWTRPVPSLIRNYDYDYRMFEGVLLYTNWLQPVIGMSDCTWGLLDGMNASGLAASLTFGGRKIKGRGFGIPLVLRYVLETSKTTSEAVKILTRIPVHMAYNVTIIDQNGQYATIFLSPDSSAKVLDNPIATNHQQLIDWHDYARATGTLERMEFLENQLADPEETSRSLVQKFLHPPLYNRNHENSFGTLYTIEYEVEKQKITILWPNKTIVNSFKKYQECKETIMLHPRIQSKLG